MFHHIRKFSSTVRAASPISETNKGIPAAWRRVIDHQQQQQQPGRGGEEVGLDLKKSCFLDKFPTDQISLRPFEVSDVDDLMAWGTDRKLSRYCDWEIPGKGLSYYNWIDYENLLGETPCDPRGSRIPGCRPKSFCYFGWELTTYMSKEDALEDIENNIIPHPWFRAICLNNRPIGKIFVDPCMRKDPFMGKIGYVVASYQWGKGIATTAVNMVLDTIFNEWPHLVRLQAHVNVENLAAHRVLEKAGFSYEWLRKSIGVGEKKSLDVPVQKSEWIDEMFLHKHGRQISIDMKVFRFLKGDK